METNDNETCCRKFGARIAKLRSDKGKTQEAATSELEAAGFNVSVSLQNNATIAAGVVISYSPATTAARGETITINVSKGA